MNQNSERYFGVEFNLANGSRLYLSRVPEETLRDEIEAIREMFDVKKVKPLEEITDAEWDALCEYRECVKWGLAA